MADENNNIDNLQSQIDLNAQLNKILRDRQRAEKDVNKTLGAQANLASSLNKEIADNVEKANSFKDILEAVGQAKPFEKLNNRLENSSKLVRAFGGVLAG